MRAEISRTRINISAAHFQSLTMSLDRKGISHALDLMIWVSSLLQVENGVWCKRIAVLKDATMVRGAEAKRS